jgi:hypothetical protein
VGTEISLDVGGLSISWSKNSRGSDHGYLFQPEDRQRFQSTQIDYEAVDSDDAETAEYELGFTRSLKATILRLELLGHTLKAAETEYARAAATSLEERKSSREDGEEISLDLMTFAVRSFISTVVLADLDDTFVPDGEDEAERIMGRFNDTALKARLPFYPNYDAAAWSERSYFGTLVGFLHPYTLLRLLGENEENLAARVEWQYGPLVCNGWAEEGEFVGGARRRQTYLIATEGSSDTHILKRAFQLLRPEIHDFFRFIDVSERHPFSGTSSLVKFAEGLAKIDVQNRTVFLFDNDAEGQSAFRRIDELDLPINMRTMVLPPLAEFDPFIDRARRRHWPTSTGAPLDRVLSRFACLLPHLWPLDNYKEDVRPQGASGQGFCANSSTALAAATSTMWPKCSVSWKRSSTYAPRWLVISAPPMLMSRVVQ